jgi:hypothetical protein
MTLLGRPAILNLYISRVTSSTSKAELRLMLETITFSSSLELWQLEILV